MKRNYSAHGNSLFINNGFVASFNSEYDARLVKSLLGVETDALQDELATKDAVILAQSERIKELERELAKYQPRFKVGDTVQSYGRIVEIKEIVDMSNVSFHYSAVEQGSDEWELIAQIYLQPLEESEADNG